jgi:hypothetical protein
MGALVQIITANSVTIKTAFTDQRGRYTIANVVPGRYALRASATLLVPATRSNLQLASGATAVVNLTLAALFDTAAWLPAERRRADEPSDDWKWTLRSTASRPILRIVDDGTLIEVSASSSQDRKGSQNRGQTQARTTVSSGDGAFGEGGIHNILAIHSTLEDGSDTMLRADMATNRLPSANAPSQEVEAGYERRSGFDGASRVVLTYMAHPELLGTGSPAGLEAFSIASAQRMSLGDLAQVEVGGNMTAVHAGQGTVAARPFLRVTAHPMGLWSLHYRMATDRQTQGFEDVSTDGAPVPVALIRNGKLALESGRHQEFSAERRAGRATLELAWYHDAIRQIAVSGGERSTPAITSGPGLPGMLIDPTTGSFRTLASGYSTSGLRFTASAPLTPGLWVAAEYSTGDAMASTAGPLTAYADAMAGLQARSAQAITAALKANIARTGTRLRASYRLQSSSLVTAVDPYSLFGDQAFLSCMMRQPIHLRGKIPQGVDATVDVTNLLAQGYRPFLSADGQTLYFAQAPRTIQAGLSFTF